MSSVLLDPLPAFCAGEFVALKVIPCPAVPITRSPSSTVTLPLDSTVNLFTVELLPVPELPAGAV